MAQGTRTGSNPNVANLSGIFQFLLGKSGGDASYIPAGGGMGGRRGTTGARTPLPTGSLRNYGNDYREEELRAGAAAEAFRPGAGFPGQQVAADRAYQQEASRVAQLTAQDPELQRYEKARAGAKTQQEMDAARDIGMQIWAAKYGNLAKQVKPGQSGYEAIQRTLYPGGTPAPTLPAESEAMLNAIAPTNEFGVRPDVTPMPGQLPSFGSATEAMFNAITGGGSLVTPMPQKSIAATPQDQAQGLAETYKKVLLGGLGSDPLGIRGIYQYGQ